MVKRRKKTILQKILTLSLSELLTQLLRLLVIVALLGIFGGIVKTLLDLELLLHDHVEEALRQLLLNVITLLAVVEVVRTGLNYLKDGRVRVTFIVDTVLIVMLNEILSTWFKGVSLETTIALLLILLVLIFIRILAIKFSPTDD